MNLYLYVYCPTRCLSGIIHARITEGKDSETQAGRTVVLTDIHGNQVHVQNDKAQAAGYYTWYLKFHLE